MNSNDCNLLNLIRISFAPIKVVYEMLKAKTFSCDFSFT